MRGLLNYVEYFIFIKVISFFINVNVSINLNYQANLNRNQKGILENLQFLKVYLQNHHYFYFLTKTFKLLKIIFIINLFISIKRFKFQLTLISLYTQVVNRSL